MSRLIMTVAALLLAGGCSDSATSGGGAGDLDGGATLDILMDGGTATTVPDGGTEEHDGSDGLDGADALGASDAGPACVPVQEARPYCMGHVHLGDLYQGPPNIVWTDKDLKLVHCQEYFPGSETLDMTKEDLITLGDGRYLFICDKVNVVFEQFALCNRTGKQRLSLTYDFSCCGPKQRKPDVLEGDFMWVVVRVPEGLADTWVDPAEGTYSPFPKGDPACDDWLGKWADATP